MSTDWDVIVVAGAFGSASSTERMLYSPRRTDCLPGRVLRHIGVRRWQGRVARSLTRVQITPGRRTHNAPQVPNLILCEVQPTATVTGAHVRTRFRPDRTHLARILRQEANVLGQLLNALLLLDYLHRGLLKRFADTVHLIKSKPNGYAGPAQNVDQGGVARRP
uniref:Uncharacterized protein n=1 Tax=Anopheles merus TaxID=30066 RepID=A0A182UTW2_ANOME